MTARYFTRNHPRTVRGSPRAAHIYGQSWGLCKFQRFPCVWPEADCGLHLGFFRHLRRLERLKLPVRGLPNPVTTKGWVTASGHSYHRTAWTNRYQAFGSQGGPIHGTTYRLLREPLRTWSPEASRDQRSVNTDRGVPRRTAQNKRYRSVTSAIALSNLLSVLKLEMDGEPRSIRDNNRPSPFRLRTLCTRTGSVWVVLWSRR